MATCAGSVVLPRHSGSSICGPPRWGSHGGPLAAAPCTRRSSGGWSDGITPLLSASWVPSAHARPTRAHVRVRE